VNDWRGDNPAAGIKALKLGEREPWPANVLEKALAAATPMTRLAIVTGLCSGARIGDAIRMQHGWHDGAMMEFVTSKNKADVAVPMHPLWLAEIAAMPRGGDDPVRALRPARSRRRARSRRGSVR
jgi:hypothetical protein